MERVVFIMEESGDRIGCLLNPESLVIRRRAGVETRRLRGGLVTGSELADDPLFFTGGGVTELTLNLVFDVSLAGSTIETDDVRVLTGPLWERAENAMQNGAYGRPRLTRLIWGTAFNILCAVKSVAQRLEYFTTEGVPRRCWMRMRLLRVAERASDLAGGALPPPQLPEEMSPELSDQMREHSIAHELGGGEPFGPDEPLQSTERLDQLALLYYGDASLWRLLAQFNDVSDPLHLDMGARMDIPVRSPTDNTA